MRRLVGLFAALVIGLCLAQPAAAQSLTPDTVKRFVDSVAEIKAAYPDTAADENEESSDWLRGIGVDRKFTSILEKHGFTPAEWPVVAEKVISAYIAVSFEQSPEDTGQDLDEAVREVQQSKDIPEEQKQEILAQLSAARKDIEKMKNAPEADKEALRPQFDRLQQVLEN